MFNNLWYLLLLLAYWCLEIADNSLLISFVHNDSSELGEHVCNQEMHCAYFVTCASPN